DPAQFPDSAKAQTRIELGWSRLAPEFSARGLVQGVNSPLRFGPAIGRLHTQAANMCVVRGMSMDTLTHPVGTRYFLTGKPPAGLNARGSSLGSELADQVARANAPLDEPVPHLVVDSEAYYVGDQTKARPFRVGSRNQYQLSLSFQETGYDALADLVLEGMRKTDAGQPVGGVIPNVTRDHRSAVRACDPAGTNALGAFERFRDAQLKMGATLEKDVGRYFDFTNPARLDPSDLFPLLGYGAQNLGTPGCTAAIARQALKYGVSRFVTIQLQSGLDTHTARWATEQPRLLKEGFDALTLLLEDLHTLPDARRGGKLIDHTTVVVFSEFSRTPYLNPNGGRDHSLTNACLLFGAGVPKNRVVGASSDVGMEPQAVDPMTGQVAAGGVVIRPEHVLASVLESAGFDAAPLRTTGLPCLKA
ncbi:MAG: DUF1501 domain-containing protein, partial [Myxococcaceae bacterium]|nr:DUF1501 domain-containing protein [Myxococcaceae bacterium]